MKAAGLVLPNNCLVLLPLHHTGSAFQVVHQASIYGGSQKCEVRKFFVTP